MILQVWTIFTLCRNSYISLEMFYFFSLACVFHTKPNCRQHGMHRMLLYLAHLQISTTRYSTCHSIYLFFRSFIAHSCTNTFFRTHMHCNWLSPCYSRVSARCQYHFRLRSKYPRTHHKPFLVSTSIHANERVAIDEYTSLPPLQR